MIRVSLCLVKKKLKNLQNEFKQNRFSKKKEGKKSFLKKQNGNMQNIYFYISINFLSTVRYAPY